MTRAVTCIYCSKAAGSREHVFPASLGGRRKHKGILCQSCNQGLSGVINKLAVQLQFLRGMLGVRNDHHDRARPAEVPHDGGIILIDAAGRSSYKDPLVLSDVTLEDGRQNITIEFDSERQRMEWLSAQQKSGSKWKTESFHRVTRVMPSQLRFDLELSGDEIFRAVACVALNFLAYRFPSEARDPGLDGLKDYIQGKRVLSDGDPRPVWYHLDQIAVPASNFELGHQVFLRVDHLQQTGYAIVRFFEAVEFAIDFGRITPRQTQALLFNIDPHVERPPNDLFEVPCRPEGFPTSVTTSNVDGGQNIRVVDPARFARTLRTIDERQAHRRLAPLADELARIRTTNRHEWRAAIDNALGSHQHSIHRLLRWIANKLAAAAADEPDSEVRDIIAAYAKALVESDPQGSTGLTVRAHDVLMQAKAVLADMLESELESGPILLDRVVALLAGSAGIQRVAGLLQVLVADERSRMAPDP